MNYSQDLIMNGDVKKYFSINHHFHTLTGIIIEGNKIGRTIGFPTANINPSKNSLIPKNGVYAVLVRIDNFTHKGMLNIGIRPTFNFEDLSIEVHIFNFTQSIYNTEVIISFIDRVRDELKFNSKEELIEQLTKDKLIISNILKNY